MRDLDDIRSYFANDPVSKKELVYDGIQKGYVLVRNSKKCLMSSEILTVCKILLENKVLVKEDLTSIIVKLFQCCVPMGI